MFYRGDALSYSKVVEAAAVKRRRSGMMSHWQPEKGVSCRVARWKGCPSKDDRGGPEERLNLLSEVSAKMADSEDYRKFHGGGRQDALRILGKDGLAVLASAGGRGREKIKRRFESCGHSTDHQVSHCAERETKNGKLVE